MAVDLTDKPNLEALLKQFNESDISPSLTRDRVLSSVKNAPKSYTKKEAQEVFGEDELTDEDIAALRAEAEQQLALKRGLIEVSQFNKTIVERANKARQSSSRKGLKTVGNIAKSKSKSTKQKSVKDILDEVSPRTTVNGRVQEPKNSSNSLKDISELSSNKDNPKNLAKFEENFLFSTQGLLNGEVLLDILKDTWDIYNNRDRKKDGDEEDKKEADGIMKSLFKLTGLLALFNSFKKKLKAGFKALKGRFVKLFGKMKEGFKKIFVEPIIKIFKYVKDFAKDLIKKPVEIVKNLAGKAVNGTKNMLGIGKKSKEAANTLKQAAKMSKTPAAKKAAKALEEKAAKQVTKEAVKSGAKKGLKGVLSKIPVASALIDIGFMEAEVRSDMKEHNIGREQAYDNYIDNKKNEDWSWWDAIDPFGAGQKVAAKVGVDKVGGWIGDKIGDAISYFTFGNESPAERMKKYEAQAKKKFGSSKPVPQEMQTKIPDNIRNPELREREKQITYIEKPKQEQNMTPIKYFDKDRDESPMLGFGYLGEY